MKYATQEAFFVNDGDLFVQASAWGEVEGRFTVEEMYQHFKARFYAELEDAMLKAREGE